MTDTDQLDLSELGEGFLAHCGIIEHRREDTYDPVKAHQYYMQNRKLKPQSTQTNDELKKVKSIRDLAYKNASSEDKKLFSIPNKQRTRDQSNRMIRLVNAANTTIEKNKNVSKKAKAGSGKNFVSNWFSKNLKVTRTSKTPLKFNKPKVTVSRTNNSPLKFNKPKVTVERQKARASSGQNFISKWFSKNLNVSRSNGPSTPLKFNKPKVTVERKKAVTESGKNFISSWFSKNVKISMKPFKKSSRFGSISFKGFGN